MEAALVEIAFCFDENMVHAACVSIASLLDFKNDDTLHYEISCICSEKAMEEQELLKNITMKRDPESAISFYSAPLEFQKAFEVRGITSSTYYRLSLHRILPGKKRLIYADTDMLFLDSLKGIWKVELGDAVLAGVKGANNFSDTWEKCMERSYAQELQGLEKQYVNAGLLLMNLEEIRKWNPDELWKKMSEKQYYYQDQDILNITCKGRIYFLPPRYNVFAHLTAGDYTRFETEGIWDAGGSKMTYDNPAALHYTGPKPWDNRGVWRAKEWWKYVDGQEDLRVLFDKSKIKNRKTTGLLGKINRHLPI